MRVHAESHKPPTRHRKPASPQEIPVPQEVAANPNPAVSAIGELSSGDPANFRRQTEESIAAIERGLNSINRTLNDSEQKTADHIREFLKQAKAALASGDVDGAHTLAAKAKVLLDELSK
jgi:ribosomal protein S20